MTLRNPASKYPLQEASASFFTFLQQEKTMPQLYVAMPTLIKNKVRLTLVESGEEEGRIL